MSPAPWLNAALHLLVFTALGWALVRWALRDARHRAWASLAAIALGLASPWLTGLFPSSPPLSATKSLQETTLGTPPAVTGDWKIHLTMAPGTLARQAAPATAAADSATPSPASSWLLTRTPHPLVALWITGAALGLLVHLARTLAALRWHRQLREPTAAERAMLPTPARSLALPLRLYSGQGSPCVSGWARPVIAISASSWHQWSPAQWRWVLQHEEAHLRAGDPLTAWVLGILRACFWWNPFLHGLASQWAQAREEVCDHAALGQEEDDAPDYASLLVQVAALAASAPLSSSAAMATSRPAQRLRARVHAVLQRSPVARRTRPLFIVGYFLVSASLMLLLGRTGFAEPPVQPASGTAATAAPAPVSTPAPAATPSSSAPAANASPLFTRTFPVRPDFLTCSDSFAGKSARQILELLGIPFPEGASAVFVPHTAQLIVKNTTPALDDIGRMLKELFTNIPLQAHLQTRWVELLPVTGNRGPADAALSLIKEKQRRLGDDDASLATRPIILGEIELSLLLRLFAQQKGVSLVSAPSVTSRMGQKATVELTRTLLEPTSPLHTPGGDNFIGMKHSMEPNLTADGKKLHLILSGKLRYLAGRPVAESRLPLTDGILPPGEKVLTIEHATQVDLAEGETVCIPSGPREDQRQLFLFVTATTIAPNGLPATAEDRQNELKRQQYPVKPIPPLPFQRPVTVTSFALRLDAQKDPQVLKDLLKGFVPTTQEPPAPDQPPGTASVAQSPPPLPGHLILAGVMTQAQTEKLLKEITPHLTAGQTTTQKDTTRADHSVLPFNIPGDPRTALTVSPFSGPEGHTVDASIRSKASHLAPAVTTSVTVWDTQTVVMARMIAASTPGSPPQLGELVFLTFTLVK